MYIYIIIDTNIHQKTNLTLLFEVFFENDCPSRDKSRIPFWLPSQKNIETE